MSIFVNFVIVLYEKISPDKPEAFGKLQIKFSNSSSIKVDPEIFSGSIEV
jgi:hypothetical protein